MYTLESLGKLLWVGNLYALYVEHKPSVHAQRVTVVILCVCYHASCYNIILIHTLKTRCCNHVFAITTFLWLS